MLLVSEKLTKTPVMSLQTGTRLAMTSGVIIDPKDLKIIALYVDGSGLEATPSVLFTDDIRESSELGFIIDDSSKLMPLDGLVRLQKIIDSNFELIGINVVDKYETKLGRVEDYSFDPDNFMVAQLFVKPPLLRSLTADTLIIHQSQIIDVTPTSIVVDIPTVRAAESQTTADDLAGFVNPFRSPDAEPQ